MSETSYNLARDSSLIPSVVATMSISLLEVHDKQFRHRTEFLDLYINECFVGKFVGDISVHRRHDGSKETRNNFLQTLRLLQLAV